MDKIIIPSNINVTNYAYKDISEIESNSNYQQLIPRINEYLAFIATSPTNIQLARNRGYRIEKLKTGKKRDLYFSIRISQGNRLVYCVEPNGKVTLVELLGHYLTKPMQERMPKDYESFYNAATEFFNGERTYDETIKGIDEIDNSIVVVPDIEGANKDKLEVLKRKILSRTLTAADVDYLEFLIGSDKLLFAKEDLKELANLVEQEIINKEK